MVGKLVYQDNKWVVLYEEGQSTFPVREEDLSVCNKYDQKEINFDLILVSENIDFPAYFARLYLPIEEYPLGITMIYQTTSYQVDLDSVKYSVDVDYNNLTGEVNLMISDSEGDPVQSNIFEVIEDKLTHAGIIQKK
jgi:hypothetical protein